MLLIKNKQNLNPFVAQVSLSLKFVSMLWSNSITFSINSFSFGLGITVFFFFFFLLSIGKNKHYRVFFFFILFSVSVTILMYSFVKIQKITLFVWWGKGFCFLPRSWVLAQVFLNSEFGLWFSWTKVFNEQLLD